MYGQEILLGVGKTHSEATVTIKIVAEFFIALTKYLY
jgi:hypothetical protein